MTHYPPVSRLREDQPEPQADRAGASGRSTPRPAPVPEGFEHRLTFWARRVQDTPYVNVVAECIPCDNWRRALKGGHDLADLINLYAQHAGVEAAKTLCINTLARHASAEITRETEGWDDPADVAQPADLPVPDRRIVNPVTHKLEQLPAVNHG